MKWSASMAEDQDRLNVGILGLGMAGAGILRSLDSNPDVRVAAVADLRENALAAFREQHDGRVYQSFERLRDDPEVEAVWVATPTHLHCEHAVALAEAGKHVMFEKPMARTLEECQRMIDAAERNNVKLIACGHQSYNPAFLAMRRIVSSGRLGKLGGLTNWVFGDWMLRARIPAEVDVDIDGGMVFNQGPHPVDALRLVGGGMVRSVRGTAIDLSLPGRPCPGYLTAYIEFEDGTPATVLYDGYGYLRGWELVPWGETAQRQAATAASFDYRKRLRTGMPDESDARELLRFGGRPMAGRGPTAGSDDSWVPSDSGLLVATCEMGEIRQSPGGLYVYDDEGRHDEPLPAGATTRSNEVKELRDAIAGRPVFRDGRWGMATMEVVLAILQSGRERREIQLQHQVPVIDV
jgi:phthalate 4,5-cis-dihydrodiol dehydrogenase